MGVTQRLGTIPLAIFTDASNNIGIGGSPSGSYKLQVTGSLATSQIWQLADNSAEMKIGRYNSSFPNAYIDAIGPSGDVGFQFRTQVGGAGGGTKMVITAAGNVGIGTSSPSQILDVRTTSKAVSDRDGVNLSTTDASAANLGLPLIWSANGSISNYATASIAGRRESATSTNYSGYLQFATTDSSGSMAERMRITSGGTLQQTIPNSNDGLFHQIPTNSYTGYIYSHVVNNGGSYYLGIERVSGSGLCNGALTYSTVLTTNNSTTLTLGTNGTARVMITAAGFLKAKGDESGYYNASGAHHELRSGTGGEWNTIMSCTAANPYGLLIGLTPGISNTGNEFISAYVGNFSTLRFKVASNGGIYNYQGNDSNLSDARIKNDIILLESYWDKFKAIEIVKFKYNDQSHDDYNIGVIAQQLEQVAPEFINTDGFGKTPEDGIPLKSVYTADLHHATIKVLQEAMVKIEELSAKVSALENKS